jgi:hypothetical protein
MQLGERDVDDPSGVFGFGSSVGVQEHRCWFQASQGKSDA